MDNKNLAEGKKRIIESLRNLPDYVTQNDFHYAVKQGIIELEKANSPEEIKIILVDLKPRLISILELNGLMIRDSIEEQEKLFLFSKMAGRFEAKMSRRRHLDVKWTEVEMKLKSISKEKLIALFMMEATGGEPNLVKVDEKSGELIFFDCSWESPVGRRNLSYAESEKMAEEWGVELLNEEDYNFLQSLDEFDTNIFSWLKTSEEDLNLGLAIQARHGRGVNLVDSDKHKARSHRHTRAFRAKLRI